MKSQHRREITRQHPELFDVLSKGTFDSIQEVRFQRIDKELLLRPCTPTDEFALINDDLELECWVGRGFIPWIKRIRRLGPDRIIDAIQRAQRSGVSIEYIVGLHAPEYQGGVITRPSQMVIHTRPYATSMGILVARALAD